MFRKDSEFFTIIGLNIKQIIVIVSSDKHHTTIGANSTLGQARSES